MRRFEETVTRERQADSVADALGAYPEGWPGRG
jgi:hypothetical protein